MRNSRIIVCTHKKWNIPQDDVLLPLHVGKMMSNEDYGYIGDDSGDNISLKNKNYCELTGLYWAWKNLNVDYVGLCHYQRYFDFKGNDPVQYLGNADIVIVRPEVLFTRSSEHLMSLTTMEDFYIMITSLLKLYPEYKDSLLMYLFNTNRYSLFNMMFCRKNLFDEYCKWLFSITEEMEKWVRLSGYTRLSRLYGYMSECLLYVYCKHHNLKIRYADVRFSNGEEKIEQMKIYKNVRYPLISNIARRMSFFFYPRFSRIPLNRANIVSCKNDKIPYLDKDSLIVEKF